MSLKNEIPEGWAFKKLGEICEVIMGQSPPSDTYNTDRIGLPFFQGKAEFTELYPVVEKYCSKPNKIAEPNDILLSVRAPVGKVNIANQKCCIGRGLAAIRFKNYKFIYYFLKNIEQELDKKGTGTTFRAVSGETIRTTEIPLPPLAEQQKIVLKIEELFSELDKGVEALKTAQQQLKIYRQSVLKHAFEGKLTNPFLKEGELPEGWTWVELNEICEVKDGTHDTPKYIEVGIPFITQKNIREKGLSFEDIKYISNEDHDKFFKRSNVTFGDILISMIGANRGMTCLVNDKRVFSIKNVGLIKSNESKVNNLYLLNFLKSMFATKYVKSLSKGGAQEFVGLTELRKFPIILAPLKEQHRIVQEIESRLSVCDKLEETMADGLLKAETLRQSILKRAFEGKLVPQHTAPAHVDENPSDVRTGRDLSVQTQSLQIQESLF